MATGSTNTALMTTTGTHVRRVLRSHDISGKYGCLRDRSQRITGSATAAALSTGTKNRKQACPWIRNQPARAAIQASRTPPAATEAIATTKAKYAGTYT